jgi:hypothetical protein
MTECNTTIDEKFKALDLIPQEMWLLKDEKYRTAERLYIKVKAFQRWNYKTFEKHLQYILESDNSPVTMVEYTDRGTIESTSPQMLDVQKKNGMQMFRLNPKYRSELDKHAAAKKLIANYMSVKKPNMLAITYQYIFTNPLVSSLLAASLGGIFVDFWTHHHLSLAISQFFKRHF